MLLGVRRRLGALCVRMLTPPRFRHLLIDSDAGPLYSAVSSSIPLSCAVSSPPSARFRLLLATGCSIWKGSSEGWEQSSASGEREGAVDGSVAAEGSGAAERRAEADEWWRTRSSAGGDSHWDKPRQEGEGHMGRLVGWASPLLTPPPLFFFFPFLFSSSSTTLSCCFKFFINS